MNKEILVKLKIKKSYKIILTFLSVLILATISVGILYLTYDKIFVRDSDIEVNGSISINYLSGKKFRVKDDENIKFTVTNSGNKPSYYEIVLLNIRGNGTYKLYNGEDLLSEGNIKSVDEEKLIDISIDAESTEDFTLIIESNDNEIVKGIINIRVQDSKLETFADLIIKNNSYSEQSLTKVGSEVALEDEGLIKDADDLGVTYYFRGNVKNNYVLFDDLTWRIVRINGDGTVRLILDGLTSVVSSYYSSDENTSYEKSEIYKYLENWYQENIKSTALIANNKYCNDVNYDDENIYNAYTRIMINYIPTFNCLGNVVNNHIGLLTIDELVLAGASPSDKNTSFYLYNSDIDKIWYTMSGAKKDKDNLNLFMFDEKGSINTSTNGNLYRGVRPVINLVKNIEMEGKGIQEEPYKVVDN